MDAIVDAGIASTRQNAVQLGRALARDLGLFSHVTDEFAFSDEYIFFRFNSEYDDLASSFNNSYRQGDAMWTSMPSFRLQVVEESIEGEDPDEWTNHGPLTMERKSETEKKTGTSEGPSDAIDSSAGKTADAHEIVEKKENQDEDETARRESEVERHDPSAERKPSQTDFEGLGGEMMRPGSLRITNLGEMDLIARSSSQASDIKH